MIQVLIIHKIILIEEIEMKERGVAEVARLLRGLPLSLWQVEI